MKTKIIVKNEIIELGDCCHWRVADGILYNMNTNHDEGVAGDIVTYTRNGIRYRGHVVGYTCYQCVETEEWGKVMLSAGEYDVEIVHNTVVTLADGANGPAEPSGRYALVVTGNTLIELGGITDQLTEALGLPKGEKVAAFIENHNIVAWTVVEGNPIVQKDIFYYSLSELMENYCKPVAKETGR